MDKVSVKVLVADAEGRVLVLRRSAASRNFPGKWDFPGGKPDYPSETFEQVALRETREETGLEVAMTGVVGGGDGLVAGVRILYVFIGAAMAAGRSPVVRLSPEHSDFQWVAPGRLPKLDLVPHFLKVAERCARQHARAH